MAKHNELNWTLLEDAQAVAKACADQVMLSAEQAINQRGSFHLVLAGGTTPAKAYALLAEQATDWSKWYFYYGDERCLPVDDNERNSVMARSAWLDKIPLQAGQHFPIPAELGPDKGAEEYLAAISANLPFDLVLLGMGEDGHTASLFPNQAWQQDAKIIAVTDSPKPPPQRVSLGPALIHSARQRLYIITGASKADAIQQWREQADLPIRRSALPGDRILIDRAAWGR